MKNKILLTIQILTALISFASAHTGEDNFGHHSMMGNMMYGNYGWGMWLGWLFMALIFITLILFIIWLIKQIQK